MSKVYGLLSWASGSCGLALVALALFAADGRQARTVDCSHCGPSPGYGPEYSEWYACMMACVSSGGSCSPTDTGQGSAPCYDKAGAQCTYNQKASTCTTSSNGSNCTCAVI